jgi:hypothetical protein
MKGGRWRWIAVVLAIALAASIALGLLGLWPDLRGESTSDRRERVQIAEAFDRDIINSGFHVSRVKLNYLPGKALVEVVKDGHTNNTGHARLSPRTSATTSKESTTTAHPATSKRDPRRS